MRPSTSPGSRRPASVDTPIVLREGFDTAARCTVSLRQRVSAGTGRPARCIFRPAHTAGSHSRSRRRACSCGSGSGSRPAARTACRWWRSGSSSRHDLGRARLDAGGLPRRGAAGERPVARPPRCRIAPARTMGVSTDAPTEGSRDVGGRIAGAHGVDVAGKAVDAPVDEARRRAVTATSRRCGRRRSRYRRRPSDPAPTRGSPAGR